MDLQLTNKVVIVTGASRGIGRAIATTLSAEGMRVAVVARTQAALEELAASLPTECLVVAADLREAEAPARVVAAVVERFSGSRRAGRQRRCDQAGGLPFASGCRLGKPLKFFGAMRMCRAASPHLQGRRGSIVNIVGIGGRTGRAGTGRRWFGQCRVAELDQGARGSRRGGWCARERDKPGSIATERLQGRIAVLARERGLGLEAAGQVMASEMGVPRFGRPEEIANAVAFLVSAKADYIHGAILDADGGATKTL